MKIDENICLVPYCQENNSIIEIDSPFCIEHSEKFKDFAKNYDGRNQIKNMLRTDIKLSNELIINMISWFCDEEEKNISNYEWIKIVKNNKNIKKPHL